MNIIIISIIIIALFVILGIFLYNGKGAFLIAGYNTLPKEEKALSKFMGKAMFALSFSMLLWVLGDYYKRLWLFVIGLILFMAIILFIIIYANIGNRFKK